MLFFLLAVGNPRAFFHGEAVCNAFVLRISVLCWKIINEGFNIDGIFFTDGFKTPKKTFNST